MYSPSSTSSARFETGHLRPGYLQDGLHQASNLTIQLQFGVKVGANSLETHLESRKVEPYHLQDADLRYANLVRLIIIGEAHPFHDEHVPVVEVIVAHTTRGLRQFIGIHGEEDYQASAKGDRSAVFRSLIEGVIPRVVQKQPDGATKNSASRFYAGFSVDDLSANLFNQANTMVAEARYARHLSERKTEEAETALKSVEEAVCLMQQQMQSLRDEKEIAEKKA
ncbi:hypothetical protein JOM56_000351 [Amanita muscaria]